MVALFPDETGVRDKLFPFTHTRSIIDLRVGILTIREKWEKIYKCTILETEDKATPAHRIPANWIPNLQLAETLEKAKTGKLDSESIAGQISKLQYPWHIFQFNGLEICRDFEQITKGRRSDPMPPNISAISPENIFIENGARLNHVTLNASTGPIYIGKNAELMEGCLLRGPIAICEGAVIKMGTIIYGGSTIGPYCVVGGEIKNSVIFEFSNKAHHGYLGDSVVGSWCNLGAGSSNSNLKNNAGDVKVWVEAQKEWVSAGQKCGLLMGDYSKSAINTSFNTGTVVGPCSQLFEPGLTPKFFPAFSWGLAARYELEKALKDLNEWKKLKNQILSDAEIQHLTHIFEASKTDQK